MNTETRRHGDKNYIAGECFDTRKINTGKKYLSHIFYYGICIDYTF